MSPSRRAGFSLVELLLSLALLALLVTSLVRLIDTSTRIWSRTEAERDLVEVSQAVLDLLAHDLASIEAGPRGDLLADWTTFDLDGDRTPGAPMQRLRLVRRPTRTELIRMGPRAAQSDLVEVVWALLPNAEGAPGESRSVGFLFRGERPVGEEGTDSVFEPGFFSATGKPPAGSMNLVTGGVLWFETDFASQTSVVHDGWSIGDRAWDCAMSWDGWSKARPDLDRSSLNAPAAALPKADELPILPRRVKFRFEVERLEDLKWRTRLTAPVDKRSTELRVADTERIPEPGSMILIDEEWMEVRSVSAGAVGVRRGVRGTEPRQHDPGRLVHYGWPVEREVTVPLYREDWDL